MNQINLERDEIQLNSRKNIVFKDLYNNFCHFSLKTFVVTPHLNCFIKAVHMNSIICFHPNLTKIISR